MSASVLSKGTLAYVHFQLSKQKVVAGDHVWTIERMIYLLEMSPPLRLKSIDSFFYREPKFLLLLQLFLSQSLVWVRKVPNKIAHNCHSVILNSRKIFRNPSCTDLSSCSAPSAAVIRAIRTLLSLRF